MDIQTIQQIYTCAKCIKLGVHLFGQKLFEHVIDKGRFPSPHLEINNYPRRIIPASVNIKFIWTLKS